MSDFTGRQFGNYRLLRLLGTGGFGRVYLGTHIHQLRDAAIKLLLKLEPPEIAQFRQEAQIIAHLVHPNIITVFDYDVAGDIPFIVMQYAERGTLRDFYKRGMQVPPFEVVKYITQAAESLQFAHDHHVIHRDVKPENMLLGPRGDLLLSDFGIAVIVSSTCSIGTQDAGGTLYYMAPEQIRGHPRPASDQYALAITAYEWLSGMRPLAGSRVGLGLFQMQAAEIQIPSLRQYAPNLSPKIDEVLQRALASDWQVRFPTVREFAQALEYAISPAVSTQLYQPGNLMNADVQATRPDNSSIAYRMPPQMLARQPNTAGIAPPPPAFYTFAHANQLQSYNSSRHNSVPTHPVSLISMTISIVKKVLSVIGIIIGSFFALFGILGSFIGGTGVFSNVTIGAGFFFFGFLVFLVALTNQTPLPVPSTSKIKTIVGKVGGTMGVIAGLLSFVLALVVKLTETSRDTGVVMGLVLIVEGVAIWLVTRSASKNAPKKEAILDRFLHKSK